MNDPISSQAAIDALDKRFDDMLMKLTTEILQFRKDLRERIPSTQPEIIRCKDCKNWEQESICEGYCSEIEKDGFDEDHFCGYAERREE